MAQTIAKETILPNGQAVIEAVCPADPTILYRIPNPKEHENEVDNLLDNASTTTSSEEDER